MDPVKVILKPLTTKLFKNPRRYVNSTPLTANFQNPLPILIHRMVGLQNTVIATLTLYLWQ